MAMIMTAKCVYLSATSLQELSHGFSCDKIASNCPLGGKVLIYKQVGSLAPCFKAISELSHHNQFLYHEHLVHGIFSRTTDVKILAF